MHNIIDTLLNLKTLLNIQVHVIALFVHTPPRVDLAQWLKISDYFLILI